VSVAVSTYQRKDRIARLIDALGKQSLSPTDFEVVVYDDASTDGTLALLRALAESTPFALRVVPGERNRGPASGRNVAWREGGAPVVAFTDDDCVPAPGWLAAGIAALEDPAVGVVVGKVEPAPDQAGNLGPFARTLRVDDARFFATANCFYRRDLLEAAGGFDERFRSAAGEDTDLGLRVQEGGARPIFVTEALVHHDVRPSEWSSAAREAWRKWLDLALVVRKHPQIRGDLLWGHVFWKKEHALLLLAAAAVASAWTYPETLVAVVPYLYRKLRTAPISSGYGALTSLPGAIALDALEVGAMVRSSARYHCLIL
jgi:GT2 family glycosyltransferase